MGLEEYRVKSFKKYVDEMLCILPFEVEFFAKHNYKVHYVGNPTVDAINEREYKDESFSDFIKHNNLPNKPIIALLAGSRKQEIKGNINPMMEAVKGYSEGYQFIVAGAPGINSSFYKDNILSKTEVTVLTGQTYRILAQSDAALVTSGLQHRSSLVMHPGGGIICLLPNCRKWGFRNILHIPYISLVNLICNFEVVKELFAASFTVDNIRTELKQILHVKNYRHNMLNNYEEMRQKLGNPGASDNAASIIYKKLQNKS